MSIMLVVPHEAGMAYTKQAWHRLYKLARWQRLREQQLSRQPICEFCLEGETVTAADTVDHVRPHKGDEQLFFDPDNLQSLCKHCHDSAKQRIERGQTVVRFGADGWPT